MKKGFTLIELLAVIVILAVIALIAVPRIMDAIDDARVRGFVSTKNNVIKATQNYLATNDNLLPKEIGEVTNISIEQLKEANEIKGISSPISNIDCEGYISVFKVSKGSFSYLPNLKCDEQIINEGDKLVAHYKFDDFQEPTRNLINEVGLSGHGSSFEVLEEKYLGNQIYRNTVTNPGGMNNFGFRGTTSTNIFDVNRLTVSFLARIIEAPTNVVGYARVRYTEGDDVQHSWNYTPSNWSNNVTNDFISVTGRANLNVSRTSTNLLAYFVYRDRTDQGIVDFTKIQLEEKPYATPFTEDTRDGVVKDYSLNGNDTPLTLENTPRWTEDGYYFDGNDNKYIIIPDNIITTEQARENGLTLSAWVRPEERATQSIVCLQISHGYSNCSNGGIGIFNGKARMIAYSDANPSSYVSSEGQTTVELNEWTHILGVFDNERSEVRVYVNGKLDGNPGSIGTFSRDLTVTASRIGIKRHNTTTNPFEGYINEVRIYNRVLSDFEIATLYNFESQFIK